MLSRASQRGFRQVPNLLVPGAVGHNKTNGTAPDSCEQQVTPVCLQDLYNIPRTPANQKNNSIAVTGFLNEYANEADLSVCLCPFICSHAFLFTDSRRVGLYRSS